MTIRRFRAVTGTTPDGGKTLEIWRTLTGDPQQDNADNLRRPDDTWKVRLI